MKTKPQFAIGDSVKSTVNHGTVQAVYAFADHFEYFVAWPDGTANWNHETTLALKVQPPAPKPQPKPE